MPWRPQEWQTKAPQKVLITFPGQLSPPPQYSSASGLTVALPTVQTIYAFDCELTIEHTQKLTRTRQPIQTGASVSYHAYIEPAELVMDIGMSDAMDSYFRPSTWQGSTSKSVSAFQTILALQFSRIPLTITTRLRTYQNMVIDNDVATDTYKTVHGLRMRIEFGQIFVASAFVQTVSSRPQETESTPVGVAVPQPPTAAQQSQNKVPPHYFPWDSIGAGEYSSVPVQNSNSLPSPK